MNPYEKIINLLKQNKIPYKEIEHEPVYTSEQTAKVRGSNPLVPTKTNLL
jgi:hypothetical protein